MNKKFNRLASMLLAVSMVLSAVPAFADNEVGTDGGKGSVPVTLNVGKDVAEGQPVLTFSVTVPTSLPVHVDGAGVVTVANNAEIVNKSSGPVEVKSIGVVSQNDWLLADWTAPLATEKVGTKKYALAIQGPVDLNTDVAVTRDSDTAGTGDTSTFVQIAGKGDPDNNSTKPFTYNAHVAPQSTPVSAAIANVVFTIGWDEEAPSGTESKVSGNYTEDILSYDKANKTYVAKVDEPILVKANIYYGEAEPAVALTALEDDGTSAYSMRKAAVRAAAPTYEWSVSDDTAASISTEGCVDGTAKVTMLKANAPIEINCAATIGEATFNAEPINFKGWSDGPQYETGPFLTFVEEDGQDFTFQMSAKNWNGTLQYSTDAINWTTYNSANTIVDSVNGKLYLRGINNSHITEHPTYTGKQSTIQLNGTDAKIKCIGNIETLLDYNTVANYKHPTMDDYCYFELFKGCTILTQAPELPATTLADECYGKMFMNCESLIQAPELPAIELSYRCYYWMFYGCSALKKAPKQLPATTLTDSCYANMFYECTSLTQVPEILATTATGRSNCYSMFNGCTSLTQLPKLFLTELTYSCYERMFGNCPLIKLSKTQSEEYPTSYRIPWEDEGTVAGSDSLMYMFMNTGGTFNGAGSPQINETYYLSTTNSIVE